MTNFNKVFVTVSDINYIDYTKALFASAKMDGEWDGDFVVVFPEEEKELYDFKELKDRGVKIYFVKNLPNNNFPHFYKIYLLDEYFKQWDWIFYVDLDCIFFNKIELNLESKSKLKLYANKEVNFSVVEHFVGSTTEESDAPFFECQNKDEIKKIIETDFGEGEAFQTCFLLFNSDIIDKKYFNLLYDYYIKYFVEYEMTGYPGLHDQALYNIVFYNKWKNLGEKFINSYPPLVQNNWQIEMFKNDFYDENNYDDVIALHFTNYFQPWKKNNLRFYPIWEGRYKEF